MKAKRNKGNSLCIHIITRMDKGGSAENTFLTCRHLNRNQFKPLLIIGPTTESRMSKTATRARYNDIRALVIEGIPVMVCPFLYRKLSFYYDLRAFIWLFITIRKYTPQIVHTHTSKAGILGRWAAFLNNVPLICHTPHGHIFYGYFNPLKMAFFMFLERITSCITHQIICLTKGEKKDAMRLRIAPMDKLAICPSGVDINAFKREVSPALCLKWREKLKITEKDLVIGTVGRLVKVKGHIFLLNACCEVLARKPGLIFCFLGSGPLKKALEMRAKEWGIINRVRFIPWESDPRPIVSLFDIFVFPSLNEGMGRALVEAMAMKKPVVATNVSGIPDLVHDHINGLLVPPKDAGALSEAIMWLADRPDERQRMGEAGEKIANQYSLEVMLRKIEETYKEAQKSCIKPKRKFFLYS